MKTHNKIQFALFAFFLAVLMLACRFTPTETAITRNTPSFPYVIGDTTMYVPLPFTCEYCIIERMVNDNCISPDNCIVYQIGDINHMDITFYNDELFHDSTVYTPNQYNAQLDSIVKEAKKRGWLEEPRYINED